MRCWPMAGNSGDGERTTNSEAVDETRDSLTDRELGSLLSKLHKLREINDNIIRYERLLVVERYGKLMLETEIENFVTDLRTKYGLGDTDTIDPNTGAITRMEKDAP